MEHQIDSSLPSKDQVLLALQHGLKNLASLQHKDGCWKGDYGGPMFLLPMYVAANYAAKREIPTKTKAGMISYLRNVQNADGSIGLHSESSGYMFTTVLCYVALRLLGVSPEDPSITKMRRWIRDNGTALGSASWGKFGLCVLNLYKYEGIHPLLPELWLLPEKLPVHPSNLWCHCRQVYLPMSYLYGLKAQIPADDLVHHIRSEIYNLPYAEIPFARHRDTVAKTDEDVPLSKEMRLINQAMAVYEHSFLPALRRRALDMLLDHIKYEDEATHYIRIGPVNAALNTIVHVFVDPNSLAVKKSFAALDQYLWEESDGIRMQSYNSTALWDTAFAVQSILATPFVDENLKTLQNAHLFIKNNQVIEDVPHKEKYFRHACRGGWPFSDRDHGWPITDCTAEGFKCAVALETLTNETISNDLLEDSINLILSFQNLDGGWATYEKKRGGDWLERLNPSLVFSNIMVDYPYVECSSACIQALVKARERFPGQFEPKITKSIELGEQFIRNNQRSDGSWEGSWAVCFTYGTWFGVYGLMATGATPNDPAIRKACGFLKEHQKPDGGWGEHFTSCTKRCYIQNENSHVVNTAWALLALVRAGQANTKAAHRAAQFLIDKQAENGDWPHQSMVGVFNKTTLINYDNYRRYFPIWALGNYYRANQDIL